MTRPMLQVHDLVKHYNGVTAVDHLSFEVGEGEIFGLLGPNGAGKTTTIRTIMDIVRPDAGSISVLGQLPGVTRQRIGYLPEERGLYRKMPVIDLLVYLGELKGASRADAQARALAWLERVDLAEWAGRKVEALSRGMQQKVQFVASLVHNPELLILDEPFQGLDPLNVDLLKQLVRQLQAEGKTVLLSAHQMNLVEALCDRIVLINKGRAVLYGRLDEIKQRYALHTVRLRTSALPDAVGRLPGVTKVAEREGTYTLTLDGTTPQALLEALVAQKMPIATYEVATVPLEEIFIRVVKEGDDA